MTYFRNIKSKTNEPLIQVEFRRAEPFSAELHDQNLADKGGHPNRAEHMIRREVLKSSDAVTLAYKKTK